MTNLEQELAIACFITLKVKILLKQFANRAITHVKLAPTKINQVV